jgi:RND family efflux transporter MFP subunit
VPVAHPLKRKVTDFVDFTGQTNAVQSVSLRPQVTGTLERMPFKEGTEVRMGDVLFEIDPRPYQALVDQAQSQVVINEAALKQAETQLDIDSSLGSSLAVSKLQIVKDRAAVDEAKARLQLTNATLKANQLNLDWTKVLSPITGRISRYYYTKGNMAIANQTMLTTIVSMDPMYAYFDVDQRTRDRYLRAVNEENSKSRPESSNANGESGAKGVERQVLMGLDGEVGFPWKGAINFIDNQINPATGTVAMRGVFQNKRLGIDEGLAGAAGGTSRFVFDFPQAEGGSWQLVPGSFVRIRLLIGEPKERLLVIDRAIGSDQGLKFVYVVDENNTVQYRRVVTGALQKDGLRVIEPFDEKENTGVKESDLVVVGSLPQLRPKMVIKPDQQPMPSSAVNEAPIVARDRPQPPPPGEQKKKK